MSEVIECCAACIGWWAVSTTLVSPLPRCYSVCSSGVELLHWVRRLWLDVVPEAWVKCYALSPCAITATILYCSSALLIIVVSDQQHMPGLNPA